MDRDDHNEADSDILLSLHPGHPPAMTSVIIAIGWQQMMVCQFARRCVHLRRQCELMLFYGDLLTGELVMRAIKSSSGSCAQ